MCIKHLLAFFVWFTPIFGTLSLPENKASILGQSWTCNTSKWDGPYNNISNGYFIAFHVQNIIYKPNECIFDGWRHHFKIDPVK